MKERADQKHLVEILKSPLSLGPKQISKMDKNRGNNVNSFKHNQNINQLITRKIYSQIDNQGKHK